ncbi:uncharacterized protein EV420DRAFT_38150 [Desarmillaria tabescens]|uniref:BZIP domain-containing protein n=1 Tax=Armillaria tabescens TaxID=1929756 RepID=A0AA39T7C0_ARMTA|nr:uncharacterized protein EV420DRAFT_38150 [Desarmillaria tabescens]KAK0469511.1 hypothetical protein EV420DRAFT_38150 [Desarmillaria tabescens]
MTGDATSSRAARVRENQRRSRQRKRDYVASLERRLEIFEKEGVKANVGLQKVARAVSAENRMLRKLLNERSGLSEADIQQYLREGSVSNTEASPSPPACSPCSCVCTPSTNSKRSEWSAAAAASNASTSVTDIVPSSVNLRSPSDPFNLSLNLLNDIVGLESDPSPSNAFNFTLPATSMSPSRPIPCRFAQMVDDPDGVLNFLFDSSSFAAPVSSFTDCDVAYRLIRTLNQRRKMKMDMVDIVLRWLWSGFRAATSGPSCCVVDDEVLYSTVVNLVTE